MDTSEAVLGQTSHGPVRLPTGAVGVSGQVAVEALSKKAAEQFIQARIRQDIFSLAEGTVTIQWPAALSAESFQDLADWLDIVKRKIGRSVKAAEPGLNFGDPSMYKP
jgi:hypothetical protein